MPEFNKQLFFDPKIDIVGKEVPLAALEKTGNVLQGRYDQAMDNETKIGAVAKKLAASSNPVDRETANQILKTYQDKLATRAKDGKYFDMVWQTQQDALDVAGMYEGLSNRNKTISEYEKMIDLNPKINDPKVKEYLKNQFKQNVKTSQFDTENNILQGLDVNAPNIVNDFDYGKWAMENAGQWKPDTFGGKNVKTISTKAGDKLPDGTISSGGLYKVIGNHVTEKVSKQEIMQGLSKMAQEHPELQATLQRDMQVYGPEATLAKLNKTFEAAADAHAYTRQLANEDSYMFDPSSTNAYYKALGLDQEDQNPVRSVRESTNIPAPQNKAISSFVDRFNKNVADYKVDTPKFQDNKENYNVLKLFAKGLSIPYLKELQQTNPETYKKITTPGINRTNDGNPNKEGGFNIYGIQNKLNSNKKLNSDELIFVTELMKDQNIQLGSAYKVRNTDDQSYAQEMMETFGENAKNSKGEYDALKADEQLNFKLFGNKNGLELKKVKGLIGSSDQTTISTHAAKGLMTIDPISGKIKPLSDYLKDDLKDLDVPDGTIIKTSGKVEPGSIMTANSSNPYNSNRNIAKAAGNAYTLDVGGNEVIVFNPLDSETTNATKSELSKFTYGVNPREKVTLHINGKKPTEMEFESDGKTVDLFFKNGQKVTMDNEQFKNWINKIK